MSVPSQTANTEIHLAHSQPTNHITSHQQLPMEVGDFVQLIDGRPDDLHEIVKMEGDWSTIIHLLSGLASLVETKRLVPAGTLELCQELKDWVIDFIRVQFNCFNKPADCHIVIS
jgi:hypothetical protein